MKATQSSLYRQMELLHLWCLETFENAPKNPIIQEDVSSINRAVIEAASAIEIALNTENVVQRLDFIDVFVLKMTEVKFITKGLTEYSSNNTQGRRVISKNQRVNLLNIMTQIGDELGRWRNSTLSKIKSNEATLSN